MSEELESLRGEVAALRAELARVQSDREATLTRRRLLTGLAGVGAAGAAGLVAAEPAAAAEGDPVTLGTLNSSDVTTAIEGAIPGGLPLVFLTGVPGQEPGDTPAPSAVLEVSSPGIGIGVSAASYGIAVTTSGNAAFDAWVTDDATGLHVWAEQGIGVDTASGAGVPLRLHPGVGPPPTAALVAQPGSIYLDADCKVWLCTDASPVTWTELLRQDTAAGRLVPITPFRALDTRATGGRPAGAPAVGGQKKGPLRGGEVLTLDLAGVGDITDGATGVIGNVSVIEPSYTGYLRAAPSGEDFTTTALSFTNGDVVAGNAFTVKLGPAGLSLRASGTASNTYHLVVDITAYIT